MKYSKEQLLVGMTISSILKDVPAVNMQKLLWKNKAVGIDLEKKQILCDSNYFDETTYYALLGYAFQNEFVIIDEPMPILDNMN